MMKKAYAKPMLYAESFALVEHIASGCFYVTNFGNQCPINEGDVTFFTTVQTCSEDGVNMINFHYRAEGDTTTDYASTATVEMLIGLVPTCYNSFHDYTQLFTSA